MIMEKIAAGIMTGTSLDGVDVAIVSIKGEGVNTQFKFISGKTYPYPSDIYHKVVLAINNKLTVDGISNLNFELAKLYADCVKDLCLEINIKSSNLEYIASHGQTVFHQGIKSNTFKPSTLQLGSGPVLSQLTKTTVISDFRSADMAQGGQGAPLVPFVDYILFKDENKSRIIQNIGGISNITILPKNSNDIYAFDTGPGNMLINQGMEYFYNESYDKDGLIARSGKPIKKLIEEITQHTFIKLKPPKSCGREQFGNDYFESLIEPFKNENKEDIIHSLTLATANTIITSFNNFVLNHQEIDELIVSGGGTHNLYLMELLSEKLTPINVYTSDHYQISSDFKEAIAFVILGNQTINRQANTNPKATGATKPVIGGSISYY